MGHYVGSFRECSGPDGTSDGGLCYAFPDGPSRRIGANFVLDLTASYLLTSSYGRTLFGIGVNNVAASQIQLAIVSAVGFSMKSFKLV